MGDLKRDHHNIYLTASCSVEIKINSPVNNENRLQSSFDAPHDGGTSRAWPTRVTTVAAAGRTYIVKTGYNCVHYIILLLYIAHVLIYYYCPYTACVIIIIIIVIFDPETRGEFHSRCFVIAYGYRIDIYRYTDTIKKMYLYTIYLLYLRRYTSVAI